MNKVYYGVYCKSILAVKTNIKSFRWVYGSAPLVADEEEYQECLVKVNATIVPEKKLEKIKAYDKRFQAYTWNRDNNELAYRQTLLGLPIGYNIRLDGSTIHANIGKNYYRFIKNRVMNLHGIYYLLSDIANTVLLNRGYLTLYAAAVADESSNSGTVLFAPPNTGKTVTATMLCRQFGYSLVGEDVVITDGVHIYGCPWTHSYRKKDNRLDRAGFFRRGKRPEKLQNCDKCNMSEMVAFSLGVPDIDTRKEELCRQIRLLNGYLFGYYNTPVIKILSYFDQVFDVPHGERAEKLLGDMAERCRCRCIQAKDTMDFYRLIASKMIDEG